jgi:hypothetical protein
MSQKTVWSVMPASVRAPPPKEITPKEVLKNPAKKLTNGTVSAGAACIHGLKQPQSGDVRVRSKFCYKCTFICIKCGENTSGVCDTADCNY